jgi:hypothetical protein
MRSGQLLVAASELLLSGILVATAVQAAPATSEELNTANQEVSPALPVPSGVVPMPSLANDTGVRQSTTVELLLQLQDQPNALEAGPPKASPRPPSRAPAGTGKSAEPPPAEPNPLLNLKTMLLGPGTQRDDSRAADRVEPASGHRSFEPAGPTSPQAPSQTSNEPRESLLSHPVVRFIRENRVLTISVSIGVLAGIWLTANFPMRRRR